MDGRRALRPISLPALITLSALGSAYLSEVRVAVKTKMKAGSFGPLALAAVLQVTLVAADTSLYIPGFDPQPLTVDVEGVDSQGRTTYVIGAGVSSGTFGDPAFVGSATMVADATEAHIVYVNSALTLSVSEDCAIASGLAVCSGVASLDGTPAPIVHQTETVSSFAVQFGGSVSASAASQSASSGSGTPTPSAGSGVSSGPSQTGPSGSGATPTTSAPAGNNNGVGRAGMSFWLSLGAVGLVSAFFS